MTRCNGFSIRDSENREIYRCEGAAELNKRLEALCGLRVVRCRIGAPSDGTRTPKAQTCLESPANASDEW